MSDKPGYREIKYVIITHQRLLPGHHTLVIDSVKEEDNLLTMYYRVKGEKE